jgi:HEAT repeat protein
MCDASSTVWHGAEEWGKKVGPMRWTSLALFAPLVLGNAHVLVPAGGGLPQLDVKVDLSSAVVDAGGQRLPITLDRARFPKESDVTVDAVAIGGDRHVVHVRVPAKDEESNGLAWEAILAPGRPQPIFAGLTGFASGDPGERTGQAVQVRPNGTTSFVLVGTVREDLRICGQSVTLLEPLALYPASLELRSATVQRLEADQQNEATPIAATDKGQKADVPLAQLLVARGSSVPDSRGAELTDGDAHTAWTERRPGVGQGEFVVMAAPRDVPIARMEIVASALGATANAASPRMLYLVTNSQTFRVTLPSDPAPKAGEAFDIAFPAPIEASCVALVLDTAYARGLAHPDVGVAELVAYSEFDGPGATLADVASKLATERGIAAAQVLERGGAGALAAVEKAYDALDARGRALAMDVAASHERCEEAAPLLSRGLCEPDGQAPRKAREKLLRCKEAAPVLARALQADGGSRACLAPMLATLAPEQALAPIADAMGSTPDSDHVTRDALRAAFAQALRAAPRGPLAALLSDNRRNVASRLEVMRAAGARVTEAPAETNAAAADLLGGAAPMRTRYLVLDPLGELARIGDHAAAARIAEALAHDADWPVRAHAAELASRLPEAQAVLAAAATDSEPRVREAALGALAPTPTDDGVRAAADVLVRDGWSFVRVQAVSVLANAPASVAVDGALGKALGDRSPRVRGSSIMALARRRATSWISAVRDRLEDRDEDVNVRAEAASALGGLCDARSVDRLTDLARALASRDADEASLQIGLGALIGLAAIKPRDLRDRILALTAATASSPVRAAAQQALVARGLCP